MGSRRLPIFPGRCQLIALGVCHFPFSKPNQRLLRSLGFVEHGHHALGKATVMDVIRFPA